MTDLHWIVIVTARRLLAMDEPAREEELAAMEPRVRDLLRAQMWQIAEEALWPRA
jgi:hypothetical protein